MPVTCCGFVATSFGAAAVASPFCGAGAAWALGPHEASCQSHFVAPMRPPTAFGDSSRHRKCLEQDNEDLREQLQNNPYNTTNLRSALDQQRRIINDIHKRVIAVTKGFQKPSS